MTMTLPTNDFENRELSTEELEAIAAGGFFGSIWHGIEHAATSVAHFVESPKGLYTIATVAGAVIFGAYSGKWTQ
jgi:hypothetical protein